MKQKRQTHSGFHHKHSLGQNFIEDEELLEQLAALSLVSEEDCVLEIGPGLGALTKPLAKRANRIVSLEIDHTLIPLLICLPIIHYLRHRGARAFAHLA